MLRIRPFPALRPRPDLAERVASVPYDVVNRAEAAALAKDEPLSFLHVLRPEIDLPEDMDPHDDRVYAQGRAAFAAMCEHSTLIREDEPSLYVYEQQATLNGVDVRQAGLVTCCHVDDYARGVIKKHEKTRKDKEDDRTRHVLELDANAGPVFLMYRTQQKITALVDAARRDRPLYDFTADDGVRHVVWRVADPQPFVEAFAQLPAAYVADGHHRTASAARAGAQLKEANPNHRGDEEYNWFLAVLFDSGSLRILPYHRVVKDLNGMSSREFLARLGEVARVQEEDLPEPTKPGSFGMYLDGQWYRVILPHDRIDLSDPVASLDYVLLADHILGPVLGIGDIRTDTRIDFVGGIRGTAELERRVDGGEAVAFAMRATTIEQLMAVADAGMIMPPKSTWFEPKLRSGLLVHTLDTKKA